MVARPAFGGEDAGHGGGLVGIGGQAIHRFGGHGHEGAALQRFHGLGQRLRVGGLGRKRQAHGAMPRISAACCAVARTC